MPQGTATTARHLGALSAPFRFDALTHAPRPPVEYAGVYPPQLQRRRVTSPALPKKQHITAGDYNDDSRYAEWQQVNGNVVPCRVALTPNLSELFSAYAISLDADRASSAASNHALQLAATDLEYEVTRVKSPVLGRDLNPMGRGDGTYYCNGGNYADGANVVVLGAKPALVGEMAYGFGSGLNNYDPDECRKLMDEQLRRLEEDPACKKELVLNPNICCVDVCGVGLPDGEMKRALRRSCECCCCLAKGCPPCLYPLPKECIVCCVNGYKGPGGVPCECTDTSKGNPCTYNPCADEPTSPCSDYGKKSIICKAYYDMYGGTPYRQVSPRELCETCGEITGSGEDPCTRLRGLQCIEECGRRHKHWWQIGVRIICTWCCRWEHEQCKKYFTACACDGYSY